MHRQTPSPTTVTFIKAAPSTVSLFNIAEKPQTGTYIVNGNEVELFQEISLRAKHPYCLLERLTSAIAA